jgi:hypothetical protein
MSIRDLEATCWSFGLGGRVARVIELSRGQRMARDTLSGACSGCGDADQVRDDGEVLEVACQQRRVVNVRCRGDRQVR